MIASLNCLIVASSNTLSCSLIFPFWFSVSFCISLKAYYNCASFWRSCSTCSSFFFLKKLTSPCNFNDNIFYWPKFSSESNFELQSLSWAFNLLIYGSNSINFRPVAFLFYPTSTTYCWCSENNLAFYAYTLSNSSLRR